MALLDESNLLAERARHAKFRTNHVGTKLNEAELHELGELVAKRKETPAELIRGLILRELKRDKAGIKPSVEMVEITALRLPGLRGAVGFGLVGGLLPDFEGGGDIRWIRLVRSHACVEGVDERLQFHICF
jgi:hypothetical protein